MAQQFEIPPLGKYVIQSYDAVDQAFPIVITAKDPLVGGYVVPANYDACLEPRFSTHVFVGVTVTQVDNRVLWTYMLLPGPLVPYAPFDPALGRIQETRQNVRNLGQTSAQTATTSTTYEALNGSDVVLVEIVRVNSNGSGGAGNPVFPTFTEYNYVDDNGSFKKTRQLVVKTGSEAATLVYAAGVTTRITYEAYQGNPNLLWKVTETNALPGVELETNSLGVGNLIPPKFLGAVKTVVTEQKVEPDYTFPVTLTPPQVSIVLKADSVGQKTLIITEQILDVDADPLLGKVLLPTGKIAVTSESLIEDGAAAPTVDVLTESYKDDPLGNGKSVRTIVTGPALFTANTFQKEIPDLTPPEFQALITTEQTSSRSAGTASMPTLGAGELSRQEVQRTDFEKEVSLTARAAVTLPVTITESSRDAGGQVISTAKTLATGVQTLAPTVTTLSAQVDVLGDGRSVKRVATAQKKAAGVYGAGHPIGYSKDIGQENLVPGKYRGQVVHETTVEQKTLTDPDVLPDPVAVIGVDDVASAKTEKVNDEQYQETTTTETIDVDADPILGQQVGPNGVETTSEALVVDGTDVERGYLVKSSEVTPLGNGKSVISTVTYPDAPEPLTDRRLEEGLGIPVPYSETKEIIAHNPANIGSISVAAGVITVLEYQQVRGDELTASDGVDIKITGVLDTADLPAKTFGPGNEFQSLEYATRNYSFPDEIRGVNYTITGTTIQRSRGYSGPVECLRASVLTLPTTSGQQAEPSRLFVPVKWYTDAISLIKTTGSDLVAAAGVWVSNSVEFGNGINGALHSDIVYVAVLVADPVTLTGPQSVFIGTLADLADYAELVAVSYFPSGTVCQIAVRGLEFIATDPPTLDIDDIETAQPDSVADFGATWDDKWVCIAVESQPWRFGCLLETYWFCKPVRSDAARDADPYTDDYTYTVP